MTSVVVYLPLVGLKGMSGQMYSPLGYTMPMGEALVTAGKSRMRPILMTTLTTIMSMVPLCISRGGSEDAMKGMALADT